MTNKKTKQTRPVDWNRFVQQPDPEVKAQYDASTEKQMHRIIRSSFCIAESMSYNACLYHRKPHFELALVET